MTYIVVILVYLGGLVVVGAYHARNVRSQEDFAIAGRALGVPILVGTMMTTWIGTGSLFGNTEETYKTGIACIILPLGGVLGLIMIAVVAGRVRRFEQITVLDIIERRFGVAPRLLGTVAIITAYLTIVSYQYRAGGAVIHAIYDRLDLTTCTQIAAAFIIVYTVLAGMVSVARTDVVNGVVMILGLGFALPWLYGSVGGLEGLRDSFAGTDRMELIGPIGWLAAVNLLLPPMLLVMGEANLYQRFFSARSVGAASLAAIILVPAVAIVEVLIIVTAWVASGVVHLDGHFGHVLIVAARDYLPTAVGALMLAAAVAIIVSTADSFLLVVATSVVRDVYHRFISPDAKQRNLVIASRVVVVVLGLVAYVASQASDQFLSVALWAYTVYGASITPALLATFFWRRATAAAAAASIAVGAGTTVLWKLQELRWAEVLADGTMSRQWYHDVDAVLPALAASVLALVVISLITPKPSPDQWKPFARVA